MCYYARGISYYPNANDTTKLKVKMFTKKATERNIWVAGTNYTGYAVMYSCWMERFDGTCDPSSTFAYTLNRVREGHTAQELKEIEQILRHFCIDPADMSPIVQAGGCNFDPLNFPKKNYAFDRRRRWMFFLLILCLLYNFHFLYFYNKLKLQCIQYFVLCESIIIVEQTCSFRKAILLLDKTWGVFCVYFFG